MATLPAAGELPVSLALTLGRQPGLTHRLDWDRERIMGTVDGLEALRQAIELALSVERYAYPIYSRRYGVELADLVGQSPGYAMSEMKRRIREALVQDDRIDGVEDWSFETGRGWVRAEFTVQTIYGPIKAEKEVEL